MKNYMLNYVHALDLAYVKVIECSNLRGGGGELGTLKT